MAEEKKDLEVQGDRDGLGARTPVAKVRVRIRRSRNPMC